MNNRMNYGSRHFNNIESSSRYNAEEEVKEYYSMEKDDVPKYEEELDVAHPETLVAVPCDPKKSKYKVVRGLMDFSRTDSLIAKELLDSDLRKYVESEDNITAVDIPRVNLPVFTKENKFPVKFHVMPRKTKGEPSYQIIIGMKDLRRL